MNRDDCLLYVTRTCRAVPRRAAQRSTMHRCGDSEGPQSELGCGKCFDKALASQTGPPPTTLSECPRLPGKGDTGRLPLATKDAHLQSHVKMMQ